MSRRVHWRQLLPLLLLGVRALAVAAQSESGDLRTALETPRALQSRVRFDHVTTAEGLSHDSVFAILQDRKGFLWFGTQGGLNRYDGHRMTHYRHDPRNPNSLASDFVQFLFEDSRGGIWAGPNLLSRFDPLTETFTRYALPDSANDADARVIQTMCEDASGFLWLAGVGRIVHRLDPKTGKTNAFELKPLPEGQRHLTTTLYRDRAGTLWLSGSYGLLRLDPTTGESVVYPQTPGSRVLASIKGIAEDGSGKLWLATLRDKPNFFDPAAGVFARRWAAPDGDRAGAGANSVVVGKDGVVWRGTTDGGVEVFDPATGGHATLRNNAADRRSLSGNEILSMAFDRAGSLWIGTKGGGVDIFSPDTLRFGAWRQIPGDPKSLSDENVRAIHRDRAGTLWIGTYSGGLSRFDPVSGSFTHFRNDPRNPASLDNDRVYTIYEDRAGALWIGTVGGLNRMDRRTGVFTRFGRGSLEDLSPNIPTYSILEDRRGGFWFGAGEARASLERHTGGVTPVAKTGGLSMLEDREGNLWFASAFSLTRMDPSGKTRAIALPQTPGAATRDAVQINYMHEGSDGLFWFAAETGLFRFDPKTEQFTSFTTLEGLPDNVVQCILPGQDGELWLSTNQGLSRFQPRDGSFVNYRESDGLQGAQFNRKACFADASGVLYFGGLHGFNMFDPRPIPARSGDAGKVVLTELRIQGKAVAAGSGSPLRKPIWEMEVLELPASDNGFSLEFAALSYRDQANIRYRFRLEELEPHWTETDSRSRTARYTGLPPGKYRFRAQASTDGRTWGAGEASIAISIPPPWWMTPWSRIGAVVALASLIFGIYKARVGALRRQGKRLQELVEERTAEVVEARNQSEQARIEAERANRAKSVFLANMSHELRTPLNAILGFTRLLHARAESEGQRRDLDIINRSGEHLLTLINDVLDIVKIEAGRMTIEIAPCDLQGIVGDVAEMMRSRAAEKGLALVVEVAPETPGRIHSDAGRLREVLINLMGNAVKYTEEGSVTLRLGTEPGGAEGEVRLRFEVEDTGVGIAPEDRERIFLPFEQAGTGKMQKGTGLGLSITREVVGLMGGRIELQSEPGGGSCFRVWIPAKLAGESDVRSAPAPGRVLGLEEGQPEYRVLVVEDERANWMVLERLLREAGFRVRVAENGEEGIVCFREWRPHFIWMDLRLPGMGGIEATQRIRALDGGRDVKIAAITASGFDSRRDEVLAAGLDDYLRKPYRPEEIFDCLARHLAVRYRREAAAPSRPDEQRGELTAEAVAALPAAIRDELQAAFLSLDSARIQTAVRKVSEHDAVLGRALAHSAERLAYSPVLRALAAANSCAS